MEMNLEVSLHFYVTVAAVSSLFDLCNVYEV